MRAKTVWIAASVVLLALPCFAQETPKSLVTTYEGLADIILGARQAEANLVRSILEGHYRAAKAAMKGQEYEAAAAEMALFASEGDNAVGGVRKRLLEGGHHFNAEGEEQGIYEPGFVIVTREAKQKALKAATDLRRAETEEARKAVWKDFAAVAKPLLSAE